MTLKRRFINDVYNGDYKLYRKERKTDYLRVQFMWSCWMDALLKNGEITERRWSNAIF